MLYLSECIRSRAIMCAIYYMRRDWSRLAIQLRIISDLYFALGFLLDDEKDYSEDDESYTETD